MDSAATVDTTGDMRRKNLLTQVLVANLLLIVAAVVAAGVAGNPSWTSASGPSSR